MRRVVCVTGVTGFAAAFVVESLLERGYIVHGTTRASDSPIAKQAHLFALPGAADRLKVFEADIMNRESLMPAFRGCEGVFHMATPIEIPLQGEEPVAEAEAEVSQIKPALTGLRNVFDACAELGIKRICLTSSNAAISFPPPESGVINEECWSDEAWLHGQRRWYTMAKTRQERLAWELAEAAGVTLCTVCPPYIFGPRKTGHLNFSHAVLLEIINGAFATIPNDRHVQLVDARDVAAVHVLGYERDEGRRYFACAAQVHMRELCATAASHFPQFSESIPTNLADEGAGVSAHPAMDNARCVNLLGRAFRGWEETIIATIRSLVDSGDAVAHAAERVKRG